MYVPPVVPSPRRPKKLLNFKGPAIIIADSGMCTGRCIVDHLRHGLEDPANDIFLWDTRQREPWDGALLIKKFQPKPASIPLQDIQPMPTRICWSTG